MFSGLNSNENLRSCESLEQNLDKTGVHDIEMSQMDLNYLLHQLKISGNVGLQDSYETIF